MRQRTPIAAAFSILIALVLLSGCSEELGPSTGESERLTLQLHWIPDTHQIGFWVALDKGFYLENGLDVTVLPGGLDANPIKDVLSGTADIGQVGGIEQVLVASSEDLPVKAIAAIHRETPHALISLSTSPIREPEDFAGKTIAVAYGDTAEILLKTYMNQADISQSSVTFSPFRFDITPLLSGQVDAITGFSTGQPATIESLGRAPVVLSYTSAGVSSYGYTLVSSEDSLAQKRLAIENFVDASRKGWTFAFANPIEAVALFKDRFQDAINEAQSLRELELIRPLMLDVGGGLASWKIDPDRVSSIREFLQEQGQLTASTTTTVAFDNGYTQ